MGRKVKGNAAHRAKKRAKETAREIAEEQANQVATGHIQKKPDDCPGRTRSVLSARTNKQEKKKDKQQLSEAD